MRTSSRLIALSLVLGLFAPAAARATHVFTETNDDVVCVVPPCPIADNLNIKREVPLMGVVGLFRRDPLTTFLNEPALPVANAGDIEMLWDNGGAGASATLALTPNDDDGNYDFLGVTLQTDFAMEGDLEAAMADAGVVQRHQGPDIIFQRKFYCAYGQVRLDGGLKVRFRISKWIAFAFEDLDSGALVTADYEFIKGDNYRIAFEVTEPDADGVSTLTADFYHLTLVDGVVTPVFLERLSGTDSDLEIGQIGLYANAGSFQTQIAFDQGVAAVSPASTPVQRSTWGQIKALYR